MLFTGRVRQLPTIFMKNLHTDSDMSGRHVYERTGCAELGEGEIAMIQINNCSNLLQKLN